MRISVTLCFPFKESCPWSRLLDLDRLDCKIYFSPFLPGPRSPMLGPCSFEESPGRPYLDPWSVTLGSCSMRISRSPRLPRYLARRPRARTLCLWVYNRYFPYSPSVLRHRNIVNTSGITGISDQELILLEEPMTPTLGSGETFSQQAVLAEQYEPPEVFLWTY